MDFIIISPLLSSDHGELKTEQRDNVLFVWFLFSCPLGLYHFGYFNYPENNRKKKSKGKGQVGFMVLYIINHKPQCHAHKHNKYAHSILYTHVVYYIHRYLEGMYSRILTGRL